MLTLARLDDLADGSFLGGTASEASSLIMLANQAGRHLMGMHSWQFAEGAQTWLPFRVSVPTNAASGGFVTGTYTASTRRLVSTVAGQFNDYSFRSGDLLRVIQDSNSAGGLFEVESLVDSSTLLMKDRPINAGLTSASVEFHLDLAYAELPSDFGEILAVDMYQANATFMDLVSLGEILRLRSSYSGDSTAYRGALNYGIPSKGAEPVPRLELSPSPLANDTKAARMFYRHKWRDLNSDDTVLDLHPEVEPLYIEIFKAFLLGYEEHDLGSSSLRLAEVEAGPIYMAAKKADGRRQSNLGHMRGTHTRSGRRGTSYIRQFAPF